MMISETDGSLRKRDDHVQHRRLSLIDFSSADDSLIDPVSVNPLHHQPSENQEHADLLYTPNSKNFEDAASKLEEWEQEPRSNETLEIEKPKKISKCNLRKSLAWDSAFFTSAGVLDPEELSSIIEGVEKDEKPALPGIQEDVYKSCDSMSTLESDSLTLESLDTDLFEDIRASIQKSSETSNLASGNSKHPSGVAGFQTGDPSKKDSVASHNKMKAPPASKNPSAAMQGLGKMTKKNPILPQFPQKLLATRRESSISKQSNLPGKSSPSSTLLSKRVSVCDLHVKSEKDKAKRIIGRGGSVSKATVIGGSRGIVPKASLSSKSPLGTSISTKTKSATSTSGSNLPGNTGKSPFNSLKRKVDAGTTQPRSSASAVRTPSRIASRNKTESGNSSLSSLMSVTNLPANISPASSISDWSSESSSTSMAKPRSNSSRTSVDSSSSRNVLSDADAHQATNSQNSQSDSSLEGQESQPARLISQFATTAPAGTVLPPAPVKPSGLRMPSPKIGFFDGVKSSGRTPRGGMQPRSGVPRGLPKHGGGSPSEGPKEAKLGKLQSARSIMSVENTKPNNQQNSHALPLHESLGVAIMTSSALQNVKSSSEMPMDVQNETHFKSGAGNLNTNYTVAEEHLIGIHDNGTLGISIDKLNPEVRAGILIRNTDMLISDMCFTEKEVLDIFMYRKIPDGDNGMHSQSNGATLTDGDHNTSVSRAIENVENTSPSHVVEKAPVIGQLDLTNDLHPLKGVNSLENPHYVDRVGCLSRQVALMDINCDTTKKFNGDSLSFSQPHISLQDKSNCLELPSHKELLDCPKKELLEDSFTAHLSVSTTSFDMAASTRTPFAVKDSLCNMDGPLSIFTESTVREVKPTNLTEPKSIMKEND